METCHKHTETNGMLMVKEEEMEHQVSSAFEPLQIKEEPEWIKEEELVTTICVKTEEEEEPFVPHQRPAASNRPAKSTREETNQEEEELTYPHITVELERDENYRSNKYKQNKPAARKGMVIKKGPTAKLRPSARTEPTGSSLEESESDIDNDTDVSEDWTPPVKSKRVNGKNGRLGEDLDSDSDSELSDDWTTQKPRNRSQALMKIINKPKIMQLKKAKTTTQHKKAKMMQAKKAKNNQTKAKKTKMTQLKKAKTTTQTKKAKTVQAKKAKTTKKTQMNKKMLPCSECKMKFKTKTLLKRHMDVHNKELLNIRQYHNLQNTNSAPEASPVKASSDEDLQSLQESTSDASDLLFPEKNSDMSDFFSDEYDDNDFW